MKKVFKFLIVLPIIYLVGLFSLLFFGILLIISDATKWQWPGNLLLKLGRFYEFLGNIERW